MKRYLFNPHKDIALEDLINLPKELREEYFDQIIPDLRENPKKPKHYETHDLYGELRGYLGLEIEWNNDPNKYRLVYRIFETPAPKHVYAVSIAEHGPPGNDPVYDLAKERLASKKRKKKGRK